MLSNKTMKQKHKLCSKTVVAETRSLPSANCVDWMTGSDRSQWLLSFTSLNHLSIIFPQVDFLLRHKGLWYQSSLLGMCSVISHSLQPRGLDSARLLCPWNFSRQEYWSELVFPAPTSSLTPLEQFPSSFTSTVVQLRLLIVSTG